MCFSPPHYITPIFPLCWMAIRGPDAKLWKQQHLAPWQNPQADLLPASKLCLGLLQSLAADGRSGLPRASGSQSWLSFDSEDFTHFYSFVKKGPSKCFMKPTQENINGSNFAFEEAEVSAHLGRRHDMPETSPRVGELRPVSVFLFQRALKEGGFAFLSLSLSLPLRMRLCAYWKNRHSESSTILRWRKSLVSFVFLMGPDHEDTRAMREALTTLLLLSCAMPLFTWIWDHTTTRKKHAC